MEYELCKKLKDAGFNQKNTQIKRTVWTTNNGTEDVFESTLPELIKACGTQFKALKRHHKKRLDKEHIWQAVCREKVEGEKVRFVKFWGKTEEEAVAKLWLYLNNYEA